MKHPSGCCPSSLHCLSSSALSLARMLSATCFRYNEQDGEDGGRHLLPRGHEYLDEAAVGAGLLHAGELEGGGHAGVGRQGQQGVPVGNKLKS